MAPSPEEAPPGVQHDSVLDIRAADDFDLLGAVWFEAAERSSNHVSEIANLVERTLREADGTRSAAECAAATGISRVSARRYLEHFHTTGTAAVALRYGAAGRPERRYGWRG